MKAIVNTKLITENGIIWDGALTYEDGRIVQAGWAQDVTIPAEAEIYDAGGLYTAPGLIDIHNHGGPDVRFYENPKCCAEYFLTHGVTTVLPTLYCDLTCDEMIEALHRIREASQSGAGRIIDGLYMEGPYMSGFGSNQKYILWNGEIRKEEYAPLLEEFKGYARVWAIDPARTGIVDFMKDVKEADPEAIFANGHSNATFAQCRAVKKYGVKVQTHFNDSGQAKGFAQGTAGSGCDHFSLHEPDLYAELICDENGIHVDADLIKTLVRTKGVERVILISDCSGTKERHKNNEADGIAYGPDLNYDYEGHLSGSLMTLENGCRNLMKHTAYGLCHAVQMGSLNAARMLGIDDEVGSLEAGKKANILLMDDMVHIKRIYFEGEPVVEDGRYCG